MKNTKCIENCKKNVFGFISVIVIYNNFHIIFELWSKNGGDIIALMKVLSMLNIW